MWKVWRSDFIAGGRKKARECNTFSTTADGVVGHGREGNRVLLLFFSFLFACFYDIGGFEVCNQVSVLPRNMEWKLKRRCSVWKGKKKQTLSLKAYFHNNTHEQADFFSAEPQLLQHRCTAPKVLRPSMCCTVSWLWPHDRVCRHLTAMTGKVRVLNERAHWLPGKLASRGSSIKPDFFFCRCGLWRTFSTPHNHYGVSQMRRIPPYGLIAAMDQLMLLTSCCSPLCSL